MRRLSRLKSRISGGHCSCNAARRQPQHAHAACTPQHSSPAPQTSPANTRLQQAGHLHHHTLEQPTNTKQKRWHKTRTGSLPPIPAAGPAVTGCPSRRPLPPASAWWPAPVLKCRLSGTSSAARTGTRPAAGGGRGGEGTDCVGQPWLWSGALLQMATVPPTPPLLTTSFASKLQPYLRPHILIRDARLIDVHAVHLCSEGHKPSTICWLAAGRVR